MLKRILNVNPKIEIETIKKTIQESGANIKYAAIFGSYITGRIEPFSDIDLLLVCENNSYKMTFQKKMLMLSKRMGRAIHLNDYISDEFEERIRHHDYKLASILKDTLVLVKNGEYDTEINKLEGEIGDHSIRFNQIKGVETIHMAMDNLEKMKHYISLSKREIENSCNHRYFQNLCIRYSHMALGYLLASHMMRETGRTLTFGQLLEMVPIMKKLTLVESIIKRRGNVSTEKTEEYVQKVKSEFVKYLS